MRMDRLVCLKADQAWWVLDYKLATRPQDLPTLRDQLAQYRQAVQRLQPGQTVRAAFVTGDGQLVEPDPG